MNHSILGVVALGYAPQIDPQRMVTATRLTVVPLKSDAALDASSLLEAVGEVWPAGGSQVVLAIQHEGLLKAVADAKPSPNIALEVPAFIAADASLAAAFQALKAAGNKLLLKGQPSPNMSPALLPSFKFNLLDPSNEALGAAPGLAPLLTGVRGAAEIDAAFKRGAQQVIGWPMDGAYVAPDNAAPRKDVQADLQVIVELMSRVDQGEDIDRLEQTLKRDPSLAFKLLRYMNSAAFGLSVEVSSFRHAIMLLGYSRLKRWLALLLTTASKDHSMRPIMYGALRRGLLMEELAKGMDDSEMRDEMFVCGLFSLLDHMLKQPFDKLLQSIPVPERVRQALVDASGPYQPYLDLVRAIEGESVFDFRDATDALMLGAQEVNSGVLRALSKAAHLE
ncbi:MAG: HDOD domain-containing protein [Paucibacter sp.]|nr:HDOD domain-containing protein [Roseateles sp.]